MVTAEEVFRRYREKGVYTGTAELYHGQGVKAVRRAVEAAERCDIDEALLEYENATGWIGGSLTALFSAIARAAPVDVGLTAKEIYDAIFSPLDRLRSDIKRILASKCGCRW